MTTRLSRRRALTAGIAVVVVAIGATSVALATQSSPVAEGDSPLLPVTATDAPGSAPGAAESVTPSPTALASPPSAAPGPSPTPDPDETAEPEAPQATPSPGPAPDEQPSIFAAPFEPIEKIDPGSAEVLIGAALTAPNSTHVAATVDLERAFADIAADAFQEEIESEWLELASSGWTLSGERRVTDLEITEHEGNVATVVACIDSSDVTLVDASGDAVGSDSARAPRASHIFTLVREDSVWRVTDRTFPDDPTC